VISFDDAAGIIRDDRPAHIDEYGFVLLVIIFNDITALRDSEPDKARAAQLRKTATKLNAVLARFEPDGAA
jgi:hypothetical protein